jgi:polysaccharide export outer membrane protein
MSRYRVFLFCVVAMLLNGGSAMAAQSSADVPVTEELKIEARQKVLGKSQVAVKSSEYVIGIGDVLGVQVYGEGDMSVAAPQGSRGESGLRGGSGGVEVRNDGRISLKNVGDVEAVGYTLTQLADYLKQIFATVYDDPIVTVVLGQSNSQRYTVMGKVANPGIFYLDYPIDLVQVVARCGGFTEWSSKEMRVVRKNAGANELFKGNTLDFDYEDFLAGKKLEKNILIKSGDIIIVD